MKFIGNLLWFLIFGWWFGLGCFLCGVLCCITLVFIPFGIAYFRIARLAFWPFGKEITTNYEAHPAGNVIWLALGGAGNALSCAIAGGILCVTIIGIPFGIQFFKLMRLSALPYGAEIN